MPPRRKPPDDPLEWLNRARSNLDMAKAGSRLRTVYFEDPCFEAQQAAEKAIKAVLLHLGIRFPFTHDLGDLLDLIKKGRKTIPKTVQAADRLTRFAVVTRYPGMAEPVTRQEFTRAVKIAEQVVRWAEKLIAKKS
ncbi:MAG: HEPN domain-containing protein [Deltaproteobacteria bacterium]|nr:HEPN domain-containing protein [Deltaproteobacteria bacterium]